MVYIFINILTEFKLYEPKSTLLIFHCLAIIRWDHYAPFFSLNEDFTLTCMKLAKVTRYRNIMLGQPGNGGEGGGGRGVRLGEWVGFVSIRFLLTQELAPILPMRPFPQYLRQQCFTTPIHWWRSTDLF